MRRENSSTDNTIPSFTSSVVNALEGAGVPFLDLRTEQANLEDVFLALTGREMRE